MIRRTCPGDAPNVAATRHRHRKNCLPNAIHAKNQRCRTVKRPETRSTPSPAPLKKAEQGLQLLSRLMVVMAPFAGIQWHARGLSDALFSRTFQSESQSFERRSGSWSFSPGGHRWNGRAGSTGTSGRSVSLAPAQGDMHRIESGAWTGERSRGCESSRSDQGRDSGVASAGLLDGCLHGGRVR